MKLFHHVSRPLLLLRSLPVTSLAFSLLLGAMSPAHAADFDKNAAVEDAKRITKHFAGSLQQELQGAMKAGGPINALSVCNTEAMPITAKNAQDADAIVSRVSLKNRNPLNVPNEWQRSVLEAFDQRAADGESIETMASASVVQLDGGKHQLRFMKAVPTGGVCLACHGQAIGVDLQAKLDELYPDDNAVGYSVGEVRGAIVVVKEY